MKKTHPSLVKAIGLVIKHKITVFSYRASEMRVRIWHTGMKSLAFNKELNEMRRE